MGWSKHHRRGLIYAAPQRCASGYTLLANVSGGYDAYLVDLAGHICHHWHADAGISYASLLPNGHLLVTHPPQEAGPAASLPGAASLLELDWESQVVWQYRHPMLHHDCERLPNGNTLMLLWAPIPPALAAQVRGGYPTTPEPPMLGDVVQEITPDGSIVTQWQSWEHLNPDTDLICPLESRHTWTHGNAITVTPNGDWLVSFRQISVVGLVERATGHWRWKWGPGALSHQHAPTYVAPDHVLLFDNGAHRYGQGAPYSRVVELDLATNEMVWEYRGDPPFAFYSPLISNAERLPNGNTLICEGSAGRLFEVTPDHEIVWEYINPFFTRGAARLCERGLPGASLWARPPSVAGQGLRSRALYPPEPELGQRVGGPDEGRAAASVCRRREARRTRPVGGSRRARGPRPTPCWHPATAGARQAMTRPTCRRPQRCWTRWQDNAADTIRPRVSQGRLSRSAV